VKGQKLFTNVHNIPEDSVSPATQLTEYFPFTCIIFSNHGGLNLYTVVHSTGLTVQSTRT